MAASTPSCNPQTAFNFSIFRMSRSLDNEEDRPFMHMLTILGLIAGTLTTVSFVPQAYKVWRTKSCQDLSWSMLVIFGLGVALWLVYGLQLRALPIIAANAATLWLILMILVMKA